MKERISITIDRVLYKRIWEQYGRGNISSYIEGVLTSSMGHDPVLMAQRLRGEIRVLEDRLREVEAEVSRRVAPDISRPLPVDASLEEIRAYNQAKNLADSAALRKPRPRRVA